jgi:hypothetical protein
LACRDYRWDYPWALRMASSLGHKQVASRKQSSRNINSAITPSGHSGAVSVPIHPGTLPGTYISFIDNKWRQAACRQSDRFSAERRPEWFRGLPPQRDQMAAKASSNSARPAARPTPSGPLGGRADISPRPPRASPPSGPCSVPQLHRSQPSPAARATSCQELGCSESPSRTTKRAQTTAVSSTANPSRRACRAPGPDPGPATLPSVDGPRRGRLPLRTWLLQPDRRRPAAAAASRA